MKTMKRFLALMIALALAASCMATAFAADSITVSAKVSAETAKPGDTIEVVVSVSEASIAGYSMKLSYDTSALKLLSVEKNAANNPGLFSANTNAASSKVGTVSLINDADATISGTLFTAKFEVLAGAADGDYAVTLTNESFTKANQEKLTTSVSGDSVAVMAPHTHNYTKVVTAPTCTEKGYTTYTCACGDSYKDDEVAALGHKWDDGVVTTEPTEEAAGVRTYTCATCGETKTEVIPALDHTHKYTTEVTAPTCTEKGYTTYTCACGDSYKADEVEALGHKYTTEVTAPTCTEAGYTTYTCSVCGDTYKSDEVAAKGHKYTAPTFAWSEDNAACTVSYSCGECGESFTKDAVVTVKDDSTCTVAGTITYTAAVEIDGESYSDVKTAAGAVLPHEYEITCTWKEDNTVAGVKMVCKSCGDAHEVAGEEVTVSEEKKANGEIVHIASFVVNGQTYSVTKVIPAPNTADAAMLGLYGTMLLMAAAALVVLKKKAA